MSVVGVLVTALPLALLCQKARRYQALFRTLYFLPSITPGVVLALVFYVVSIDPQDNMITRDYVAYITSNTILLGAEFDKVISILMVTGIRAWRW